MKFIWEFVQILCVRKKINEILKSEISQWSTWKMYWDKKIMYKKKVGTVA